MPLIKKRLPETEAASVPGGYGRNHESCGILLPQFNYLILSKSRAPYKGHFTKNFAARTDNPKTPQRNLQSQ